ncbi:CDP-alcohol phosphatidyltransferase family protein [Aliihoeflea aestuarii]|jgi:phosphatidylglycerophosphate synthase|uniref:CDP-alcohol phosphatidyltransferase family protein n=1 Tax=Aliihoeflea aestuarii TaxID=453840 RepID=UPI002091FBFB|nr:CDP-alcohol phosphatidyltransferase family protein [Aliihoeflea aestuarii]MCO6389836.1 CDP-alcohol phosphatidyltransferase family protein [Aliihoeflea aestuarii]
MLDGWLKPAIDPLLDRVARMLVERSVSADAVTLAGFAVGLAAAGAIAFEAYLLGLVLLLASRIGDGLDGAIARQTRKTDFGGYLDIVLDFAFYGAIPLGFVLADPSANAVAGAVLILSFYVNGSSFLAYSVMAERRGLSTETRGKKSLFFTTGLMEASETIAFFVAFCLFPVWFPMLAYVFAALCVYTALSRIILAGQVFR